MKIILLLSFLVFCFHLCNAQSVGIGTFIPDSSAILDMQSTTKGVLIPRMNKAERNAILDPAAGLMVYQNGPDSIGFYFFNGGSWNCLSVGNNSWKTSGNSGIDTNNFIGTTDNNMLLFKINNIRSGQLGGVDGNVSFGVNSLPRLLHNTYLYSQNTAMGDYSMGNRIYGLDNTAVGHSSLLNNNATGNTAIGAYSLYNSKTGGENTALGLYAGYESNGYNNVCLGTRTMVFDTAGIENVAIGASSLYYSHNSSKNIAIGARAMFNHIQGNGNVAIGHEALTLDTAANGIIAIGRAALFNNVNRNANVAIGDSALFNNFQGTTFSSGSLSIGAFGYPYYFYAPASISYSSNNTAVGNKALKNNTTGSGNTAIGNAALRNNINGYNSVAIGDSALYSSTYSGHNVAIGSNALSKTDYLSFHNVAIGSSALKNCKSSYRNIAIGNNSMWDADSSSNNIAIGDNALAKNAGFHNVAIGTNAGNKNLGSYKLYIDSRSTSGSPNGSDSSEALIYGDFQYDSLVLNAKTIIRDNAVVKGFTKLGGNATDIPAVKMKKLSGTTANASGAVGIAHGLTQSKILSVSVFVNGNTGNDIPPRSTYTGFEYDYYVGPTQIFIKNIATNDANIINRPFKILITYEQ
jgi:trimeric autotransporter adhesin